MLLIVGYLSHGLTRGDAHFEHKPAFQSDLNLLSNLLFVGLFPLTGMFSI